MRARPPSGTCPRGGLVFAGSRARLGRIVRDVGEPVREHGPRRPARPVKKRKRPRAPGWGRSRPMGQALLAGGAELGRDVVERILQLAADRIDRPDDHHRNAGGDQAVFDSGGAAVVTQESLTHGHVVLPELSAEGRRSAVTYARYSTLISKTAPRNFPESPSPNLVHNRLEFALSTKNPK